MGVYIYPALILPALGAPAAPTCPAPKPEPSFGQIDFELGRYGAQGEAKLSRIKAEDKLEIEQLENVVKAIANAPERSVFTGLVSSPQVLFERHPELKTILESDQKLHEPDQKLHGKNPCHFHLFFYFRNPDYWNNAIILLSVLAQKYLEVDDKEGMMKVIRYCHQFKARIEKQKLADKKFQPVAYYEAILDLTEAELKAQVKGKKLKAQLLEEMKRKGVDPSTLPKDELNLKLVEAARNYYLEARDQAYQAIQALLATKDKFFWPSEPDYFSIPKALVVLGDLNVKLKEVNREEIALLRRKPSDPTIAARIAALEAENVRLVNAAFTLYDLLEKIDESKNITIDLSLDLAAGMRIELKFSTESIQAALKANQAKGYLEESERLEAVKGIFHYLKAVTMLKKAALLAQLRRVKKEDEIIHSIQSCDIALQELNYLIKELKAEIAREKNEVKKQILQKRLTKLEDSFNFHFGRLVRTDLILALLDRLNFTVLDRKNRSAWENFVRAVRKAKPLLANTSELSQKFDRILTAIEKELKKKELDTEELERQRHEFTVLVVNIAEARYKEIENQLNIHSLFRSRILQAWVKIKRLEIMIRNAIYIFEGPQGKFPDAAEPLAFCNEIENLLEEIALAEDSPDYLQIEFDYLKTILLITGKVYRDRRGNPIFLVDKYEGRIPKRETYPDKALELVERIKRNLQFLPPAERIYFKIYAQLKEAAVLIQVRKRGRERNQLILKKIKEETGREMSLVDYAQMLLEEIERQTSSVLPPYLWYNLTITLSQRIEEGQFNQTVAKNVWEIVAVVKMFVEDKIKKYFPESYAEVKKLLNNLEVQLKNKDVIKSKEALNRIINKLRSVDLSSKFSQEYTPLLAWDLHTLRAELYHQLAATYAILGTGKGTGSREGHLLYQYTQSAYMESKESSSIYDQSHRPSFILSGTGILPDKTVPFLRP